MTWREPTIGLANDIALESAEEFLALTLSRLNRDPRHRETFRHNVLSVLYELWPTGTEVDAYEYLLTVHYDIEKMPLDLLEDLSAALTRLARQQQKQDFSAGSAAQLIAYWLKLRLVERRCDASTAARVHALQDRYRDCFRETLGHGMVGDPEPIV